MGISLFVVNLSTLSGGSAKVTHGELVDKVPLMALKRVKVGELDHKRRHHDHAYQHQDPQLHNNLQIGIQPVTQTQIWVLF